MNARNPADGMLIGEWRVNVAAGGIERDGELRRLEPKVMDLLLLLAATPGDAITREEIHAVLWPHVVVGDDSLARCVSKLRRALDDDAQQPRFIQTLPKRGYRLMPQPADAVSVTTGERSRRIPALIVTAMFVLLAAIAAWQLWPSNESAAPADAAALPDELVQQADAFYARYTRQDNESAIELYQRALSVEPDHAAALAGLANALGQRALRWPEETGRPPPQHSTLTRALREGRLALPNAQLNLDAARAFAERSVQLAPDSAAAYKALGLIVSAQGDVDAAIAAYERALELDASAWGAMINLAELHEYRGDAARGLELLERAYERQPRYAELGVLIGLRYEQAGQPQQAMLRYRNVLGYAPFHREATVSLARVLIDTGEPGEAARLCERLIERTGPYPDCETFLD